MGNYYYTPCRPVPHCQTYRRYRTPSPSYQTSSVPSSGPLSEESFEKLRKMKLDQALSGKSFSQVRDKIKTKLEDSNLGDRSEIALQIRTTAEEIRETLSNSQFINPIGNSPTSRYQRVFTFSVPAGTQQLDFSTFRFGNDSGSPYTAELSTGFRASSLRMKLGEQFDLDHRRVGDREVYTIALRQEYVGGLKLTVNGKSYVMYSHDDPDHYQAPKPKPEEPNNTPTSPQPETSTRPVPKPAPTPPEEPRPPVPPVSTQSPPAPVISATPPNSTPTVVPPPRLQRTPPRTRDLTPPDVTRNPPAIPPPTLPDVSSPSPSLPPHTPQPKLVTGQPLEPPRPSTPAPMPAPEFQPPPSAPSEPATSRFERTPIDRPPPPQAPEVQRSQPKMPPLGPMPDVPIPPLALPIEPPQPTPIPLDAGSLPRPSTPAKIPEPDIGPPPSEPRPLGPPPPTSPPFERTNRPVPPPESPKIERTPSTIPPFVPRSSSLDLPPSIPPASVPVPELLRGSDNSLPRTPAPVPELNPGTEKDNKPVAPYQAPVFARRSPRVVPERELDQLEKLAKMCRSISDRMQSRGYDYDLTDAHPELQTLDSEVIMSAYKVPYFAFSAVENARYGRAYGRDPERLQAALRFVDLGFQGTGDREDWESGMSLYQRADKIDSFLDNHSKLPADEQYLSKEQIEDLQSLSERFRGITVYLRKIEPLVEQALKLEGDEFETENIKKRRERQRDGIEEILVEGVYSSVKKMFAEDISLVERLQSCDQLLRALETNPDGLTEDDAKYLAELLVIAKTAIESESFQESVKKQDPLTLSIPVPMFSEISVTLIDGGDVLAQYSRALDRFAEFNKGSSVVVDVSKNRDKIDVSRIEFYDALSSNKYEGPPVEGPNGEYQSPREVALRKFAADAFSAMDAGSEGITAVIKEQPDSRFNAYLQLRLRQLAEERKAMIEEAAHGQIDLLK